MGNSTPPPPGGTAPASGATPSTGDGGHRYAAFISYRHAPADRTWAVWLHRSLEAYRVPKRLRQARGLPPRVGRCFRDEDELPASADLSREIDAALEQSRFLIVVCSPRTPASEWVNKEVERFREMGRHDHILALLIEGEPADSFPRSLREIRRAVAEGGLSRERIERVEPLAADVRPSRDEGRRHVLRMAKLRLLACVLGVPFDDLRQREQERRMRRLVALSGGLVALLAVFAAVAAVAVVARVDAQAQRAEAVRLQGEADGEKADAQASARDARRRLVDLYARDGWTRVDAGDPSIGLLWFVRALETAAGDPAAEADARVRIATTLAASPRPLDAPTDATAADITAGDRSLRIQGIETFIIDTSTGQPLPFSLRHDGAVTFAAYSRDGRRVVTASVDKTARVWGAANGQPLAPPLRHEGVVWSAAFSTDGNRVVTASSDKTARVWDAATGQPFTPPLRHGSAVNTAAFSADGRRVVTASDDNKAPSRDSLGTGRGSWLKSAFLRANLAKSSQTSRAWDIATGEPLSPPLRHEAAVRLAAFSPDGKRVVTVSGDALKHSGEARVWDAATSQPLTPPLRHESEVTFAVFSPDGRRVITTTVDKVSRVWNVAGCQPLTLPVPHEVPVTSVALNADVRQVVTGSDDQIAQVWDAVTGHPLPSSLHHEGVVWSAAFSPDGRRVVTAGLDKTARVWDAANGQPLAPPLRHQRVVKSAAFSPDGRRVVTASADKTARVWDAASGQPLTPPLRHDGEVTSAAFSPDGRWVVTASVDKLARVWNAGPDERPVDDLKAMAELLAYQRVDATDGLFDLTADEWRARWDDLRKRYPADFRPHPDWVYEEMGLPATQPAAAPATGPATGPATNPDGGAGRGGADPFGSTRRGA